MHSKLGEFSIYFYLIFFHGTILQPKTSFKLSYTANIFTSLSAPYDRFNSSPCNHNNFFYLHLRELL